MSLSALKRWIRVIVDTSPPPRRYYSGGGGSYCSCNKVCTCVPVCQAHHLLHNDLIVRSIAEQLLLLMGTREFEYMDWAASQLGNPLRKRIRHIMCLISNGHTANPDSWPCVAQLQVYLQHEDEVIAFMAAQMLANRQRMFNNLISQNIRLEIAHCLAKAPQMYWRNRR